jgi:hypothetical protein
MIFIDSMDGPPCNIDELRDQTSDANNGTYLGDVKCNRGKPPA